MNKFKTYRSRKWLNPISSESTGAVQSYVEYSYGDSYHNVDANLSIWDCSRRIDLDFGFWNAKEYATKARKIRGLIEELERIEERLAVAAGVMESNQAEIDNNTKKRKAIG